MRAARPYACAMDLRGKTLFITGASRGIGKAIALRAARDGANIVVAAKTSEPHPEIAGDDFSAAEEIEKAGGKALPFVLDVRDEKQIAAAVAEAVKKFGGIDILVNNASAISLTGTESTPMKRYDLMHQVNIRGTFACSQACIPHLAKSSNAHILNLSPPLNMDAKWFAPHVAYTMAKYGMSMCVLGMAEELRPQKIAVNALWPRTIIATAAVQNLLGGDASVAGSRKPEIMSDAAHVILTRPSTQATGQFFMDDEVLREAGVTDLDQVCGQSGRRAVSGFVRLIPIFTSRCRNRRSRSSSSPAARRSGLSRWLTKSLNAEISGERIRTIRRRQRDVHEAHAVVELVGLVAKLVGRFAFELLVHLRDERFVFGDTIGFDLVTDHHCFHDQRTTERPERIRSHEKITSVCRFVGRDLDGEREHGDHHDRVWHLFQRVFRDRLVGPALPNVHFGPHQSGRERRHLDRRALDFVPSDDRCIADRKILPRTSRSDRSARPLRHRTL